MKSRILPWTVASLLIWLAGAAAQMSAADTLPGSQPDSGLGRVRQFSLSDPAGRTHELAEWRNENAIVLLFLATDCPISNGYAPLMAKMALNFGPRNVRFAGVYCDPDVTPASAAKHAAEYHLPFPVLLDPNQVLAGQAGARVTPEAVVLRPDGEIVYRGRIDDLYAAIGKRRQQATTHELADAIEAVLAGKRPSPAETKANGCPLPLSETPPPSGKRAD